MKQLVSELGQSLAYTNGIAMAWPLACIWRIHGVPMAYFVTPLP